MSNLIKKIVLVGATSAIAEHCARLWIKNKKIDLTLIGRNRERLEKVARDLAVRNSESVVRVCEADFTNPIRIQELVNKIVSEGAVHTVLIAHGFLSDQAVCQENLAACHESLVVNGISPLLFLEAFAGHMQKVNMGTLAIIGSVAGDRGRKSNYVYGAAKGMIERYVQGLQHRLARDNVKVILIKPGPTDTPMTSHLKLQSKRLASVEGVAKIIVKGIEQGKTIIYAPFKWSLIMGIIKYLPRFIFNRMEI